MVATSEWQLTLSRQWDVLGPFPIHAREQQHLSPAFPLNLSQPIDLQKQWPSSYADGGHVGWAKTFMNELGELKVSFPDVRWKYLRSFGGWVAVQHHAILSTSLQLLPLHNQASELPKILVHLHQGSYFTILPKVPFPSFVPTWYTGNIYDLPRSLPQIVNLPPSSTGEYRILVSGDYEIRLFGDPVVQEGSDVPVQNIKIDVSVDNKTALYTHEASQDVICDFVDGFAFGSAIGIGLRSTSGWVTVTNATLCPSSGGMSVNLVKQIKLAPGQTRVIPLEFHQYLPLEVSQLNVILNLDADTGNCEHLPVSLPVRHIPHWTPGSRDPIRASFFYASSNPTIFAVLPPLLPDAGAHNPPILALHGAGVDVVEIHLDFWASAMPRNYLSWIIMPPGRTSWGLDWHGPSAQEAWDSISALSKILSKNEAWKTQAISPGAKVILIGHSNGGQGVWHMSTHFPDRVIADVPAAAYIKSQAYIPLTQSRSAHYIDPVHRAVLESSLTPDNNDLHLSNIANIPLLAVHGGADRNVPSWHSRELVNILHTINPRSNASLLEDAGKDHWYPSVLNNLTVQQFIDSHVQPRQPSRPAGSFTLTVSDPSENGPLNGWKIHSLSIPGRLGSLRVVASDGILQVSPTNVESFYIQSVAALSGAKELNISSTNFPISSFDSFPVVFRQERGFWTAEIPSGGPPTSPVPTRLQSILSSTDTINIVYDGKRALSLATRLAHDLHLHHRLDSALIPDSDNAVNNTQQTQSKGNSVVIGTLASASIRLLLKRRETSFNLKEGKLFLNNRALPTSSSESYVFLHPGPDSNHTLVIIYSDEASLERAGRLFPIRTGVAAPDWLWLSPEMDTLGAAGLHGAGVWAADWSFQQASSWLIDGI